MQEEEKQYCVNCKEKEVENGSSFCSEFCEFDHNPND